MRDTSRDQFSALEVGIAAFYVACGFLIAFVFCQALFEQTLLQRLSVSLAGFIAFAALARIWLRQKETRWHPVNLLLVAVAGLVTLDLVA